jgi:hypothetical protein
MCLQFHIGSKWTKIFVLLYKKIFKIKILNSLLKFKKKIAFQNTLKYFSKYFFFPLKITKSENVNVSICDFTRIK